MSDNLAIINRVIQEHQRLRGNIKQVGDSVNDMEAVFSLQQAYSGWTLSSMEAVSERQKQMVQTGGLLGIGINNHCACEGRDLPPLFGELLMQGLLLEHAGIRATIVKVKSLLADTQFTQMGQEKLLHEKSHIQQFINALFQEVEEHAAKEETILNMMKKALEKK